MRDHKRELADWCWQNQLPPPLYDREAVGPSTQVAIIAIISITIIDNISITTITTIKITLITITTSLNVVPTRGKTPASCFAWQMG